MVDLQMDKALILEDDVRFQSNFKRRVLRLMEEVEQAELDWDIMYDMFYSCASCFSGVSVWMSHIAYVWGYVFK